MQLKTDNRGVTLIELVIAVSLLTIFLSGAYLLLAFSNNSLSRTQAQFIAQEEARRAIRAMEEDIRQAQAVNYGGTAHKAAEVLASGMQLDVYTDIDGDKAQEMVQYKLFENTLKRGEAELESAPVLWTTIAGNVKNNLLTPAAVIFSVSNATVNINLILADEEDNLADEPVNIAVGITVRSKEAMD